jgi:hypothetical protein
MASSNLKIFSSRKKERKSAYFNTVLLRTGNQCGCETREIVVEQVKTADARIESWLAPDGTFNLQRLFMPDLQKLKERKNPAQLSPNRQKAVRGMRPSIKLR